MTSTLRVVKQHTSCGRSFVCNKINMIQIQRLTNKEIATVNSKRMYTDKLTMKTYDT